MNKETEEIQEPAEFLEDEKPGVTYVRSSLEMKLSSTKKDECRDIVKEIKLFGINQRQFLFIIELLAMELEDNNVTKSIKNVVAATREDMNKEPSGLILPSSLILK